MKTRTEYQCEGCDRWYSSAVSAAHCESRGVPPPWPVGLLYVEPTGGFYGDKLAFAVAESWVEGHIADASLWACRDTPAGDSLGENKCKSGNFFTPCKFDPSCLDRPPVQRLVSWLRAKGITPLVWDGGKAVPLQGKTHEFEPAEVE